MIDDIVLNLEATGVTLSVSDSGCGVESKDRGRVFERFYRAERGRDTEGAGLGLSMVSAICAYHGAIVSMHNHNPGLRVQITFPSDI